MNSGVRDGYRYFFLRYPRGNRRIAGWRWTCRGVSYTPGARSDVKETLAEIAEEIINLLNQINLSETHVVCD